jgi:hypothetical protein
VYCRTASTRANISDTVKSEKANNVKNILVFILVYAIADMILRKLAMVIPVS